MRKYILGFLLLVTSVGILTSCSSSNNKTEQKQEEATYQCPMKCSTELFKKPGKCPECGMELEKVDPS